MLGAIIPGHKILILFFSYEIECHNMFVLYNNVCICVVQNVSTKYFKNLIVCVPKDGDLINPMKDEVNIFLR